MHHISHHDLQDKYRQALHEMIVQQQQPGSVGGSEDVLEARFGVGWCTALAAEAVTTAVRALPDEQLSWDVERQARLTACDLYSRAAETYRQVGTSS